MVSNFHLHEDHVTQAANERPVPRILRLSIILKTRILYLSLGAREQMARDPA